MRKTGGDWHKPLLPILKEIKDAYSYFKPGVQPEDVEGRFHNSLRAARWCLEKKLYQQFLTVIQEGIQSFSLDLISKREGTIIDKRHEISTYLSKKYDSSNNAQNLVSEMERRTPELKNLIVCLNDEAKSYFNNFRALSNWRNCMNHAWMNGEKVNVGKFKSILEYYECLLAERRWGVVGQVPTERVFLNLSNHPSALWGREQLRAAGTYGQVVDMAFPSICPEISAEEVQKLADEYLTKVLEYTVNANVTVHIMGELTFTFIMVRMLQEHGILCVASCSERIVREENGEKISRFEFVRFRNY